MHSAYRIEGNKSRNERRTGLRPVPRGFACRDLMLPPLLRLHHRELFECSISLHLLNGIFAHAVAVFIKGEFAERVFPALHRIKPVLELCGVTAHCFNPFFKKVKLNTYWPYRQ